MSTPPLRVLLFASLRDAAAWSEKWVPLAADDPTPFTPLALWRKLNLSSVWSPSAGPSPPAADADGPPGSPPWPAGLRVAINHGFAHPETPLKGGDEVAFLPPITGG